MSDESKKAPEAPKHVRPKIKRLLTTSQKAEAVALWRAGDITLDGLSKKFGKRPETFSRMFKRMGIEKGSAAAAAAKAMSDRVETRLLNDAEETMKRIAGVKDEHYKMSRGLAMFAWAELVAARKASLSIAGLKDVMATLKLAGDVIGNSRKELYALLNIEAKDSEVEVDDLPELMVRELSQDEIVKLQNQADESGLGLSGAVETVEGLDLDPDDVLGGV